MKKVEFILAAVMFLSLGCEKRLHPVDELESVSLSKKSAQFLRQSQDARAFETSVQGLGVDSFSASHHLNMGLALEGLGQGDNAMKSYMAGHKYAKAESEKFAAAFNVAQLLGKAKKVDEALEFYQEALRYRPESIEAKTNIELLIQQQQKGGGGQGDDKKNQDQQGQQQQDQKSKGGDQGDQKNKDSQKEKESEGDQQKPNQQKNYSPNKQYVPRPFAGKELSESDVKKILGELKNQEQKIRSEYNRRDKKESPRGKDW